jgi:hypothetical protein
MFATVEVDLLSCICVCMRIAHEDQPSNSLFLPLSFSFSLSNLYPSLVIQVMYDGIEVVNDISSLTSQLQAFSSQLDALLLTDVGVGSVSSGDVPVSATTASKPPHPPSI